MKLRTAAVTLLSGLLCALTAAADIHIPPQSSSKESLFPEKSVNLGRSHFTWGADVGSSIDLGGNDMSTVDLNTAIGYKGAFFQMAGVGVGAHKAFGNEYTFVPVYAIARTNFRHNPSLFFMEVKAGYSFNTLSDSGSQGGTFWSIGCGVNLYTSAKVRTHLVLSYGYFGLREADEENVRYRGNNIDYAILSFGVCF